MILDQLNCEYIIFEDVSNDSNSICILTRPIYEIEIDEHFKSVIYTSKDIKSVLTKKKNKIPGQFIVIIPYNQWTETIKIEEQEYRLAGLDMGTISLHFMILIENLTKNEVYLYTGDFFTIERLSQNEFFKEYIPKIKKLFFDNKTVKYDLNTYMDIISPFIKLHLDKYSFAMYLPHLGYEDFLNALIKNFDMCVHVNELRKILLWDTITQYDTFVDKDGPQPKLIVHQKSKSITEIKKLYYMYCICTLSFNHLSEFSSETPKILDYYLTMLQWDQHPTEAMIIQLFEMFPNQIAIHFIYHNYPCSKVLLQYVCANAFVDSINEVSLIDEDFDLSNINNVDQSQVDTFQFSPICVSTQLPNDKQRGHIEVNEQTETSEHLTIFNQENEETVVELCIDHYRDLDLGSFFKDLRYIGKKL